MLRHSPNRSQRSKGLKYRQVLQICVLVAVCFWLIYQFKHSFDKKKAFEESDANSILNTDSHNVKFGGRKDLQDPLEGNTLTVEKKDEEETEEDNGVEEDERTHKVNGGKDDSKHEENGEEEDSKPEETGEEDDSKQGENEEDDSKPEENEEDDSKHEENGEEDDNKHENAEQEPEEDNNDEDKEDGDQRGGGDEEIDEHEQERSNMEIEVDALDEDRDKDSNKNEENESEDKEIQREDVSQVEDHDHEAREEQYKGDDASSAVTHESESISTETEREILENPVNKTENNSLGDGTVAANSEVAIIDQNSRGVTDETSRITNVPIKEEDYGILSTKQDEKADNQEKKGNDLTKKSIETDGMPVTNSTGIKQDGGQGKTSTNPSMIVLSESNPINTQNLDIAQEKSSNSFTISEAKVSEKQITGANTDEHQNETSGSEKETGENETGEENLSNHDPIDDSDSSVYLEKNARIDHDTLSDMRTERGNYEEIAAE